MIVDTYVLADGVTAWFTGRDRGRQDPPVGAAGNLSHRRPHLPSELARERAWLAARIGVPVERWHLMHQVHGAAVAVVDDRTPPGAELRAVDAMVTLEPGRPLAVQAADCVPILLAGPTATAAIHAGRRGVELDVVGATLTVLDRLGDAPGQLRAVIGPAIGGCCYELPPAACEPVGRIAPDALTSTSWGTPSVDLATAVTSQLAAAGVPEVRRVGGCTHCDPDGRWFSHRADPSTGRQLGMVVRHDGPGRGRSR